MKRTKRWLALLLAGAMTLALAACGGDTTSTTAPTSTGAEGESGPAVYRKLYGSEVSTMNYLTTNTILEQTVGANVVDCLVEYDSYGNLQPALAESWSKHPISRSLVEAAGSPDARSRVKDAHEEQGGGVSATVDGRAVAAGNRRYLQKQGVACEDPADAGTVVHVAADGAYLGCILLADAPKANSRRAVAELRGLGAKSVMLTGDSAQAAGLAARELGIEDYRAGLLPEGKVQALEGLMAETKGRVAFVGDGVNDAPVLARSDVGVAMGALGSDAAIEAADVVIMDDDPARLPLAIRLSRRCLGIVRANIAFAIAVKLAFLALGALGIAGMSLAIFADVGVMVLAVLNSLRTLRVRAL